MNIMDIRSGDVLYWKGSGFWAWLVRFWTRPKFWSFRLAPFYHVGMAWRNGAQLFIVDAVPEKGVRVIQFHFDPPSHCQRTHSAWTDLTVNWLREQQYKPYSKWTAAITPFGIAGKGTRAFMCSELVIHLLERMGWDWHGSKPTPQGVMLGIANATGQQPEVIE